MIFKKINHQNVILVLAILFISATSNADPSPPIWPEAFSQAYNIIYHFGGLNTTGKWWYDWNKQAMRVDSADGRYELMCSSVLPDESTSCTELMINGDMYIIYPEKRQCCKCCKSPNSFCKINSRDWLKSFKYNGTQIILGQEFNKWRMKQQADELVYYATKDEKQIPRRIDDTLYEIQDFIVNSYDESPINPDIFALPSYCNPKAECPSSSICGFLGQNKSQQRKFLKSI